MDQFNLNPHLLQRYKQAKENAKIRMSRELDFTIDQLFGIIFTEVLSHCECSQLTSSAQSSYELSARSLIGRHKDDLPLDLVVSKALNITEQFSTDINANCLPEQQLEEQQLEASQIPINLVVRSSIDIQPSEQHHHQIDFSSHVYKIQPLCHTNALPSASQVNHLQSIENPTVKQELNQNEMETFERNLFAQSVTENNVDNDETNNSDSGSICQCAGCMNEDDEVALIDNCDNTKYKNIIRPTVSVNNAQQLQNRSVAHEITLNQNTTNSDSFEEEPNFDLLTSQSNPPTQSITVQPIDNHPIKPTPNFTQDEAQQQSQNNSFEHYADYLLDTRLVNNIKQEVCEEDDQLPIMPAKRRKLIVSTEDATENNKVTSEPSTSLDQNLTAVPIETESILPTNETTSRLRNSTASDDEPQISSQVPLVTEQIEPKSVEEEPKQQLCSKTQSTRKTSKQKNSNKNVEPSSNGRISREDGEISDRDTKAKDKRKEHKSSSTCKRNEPYRIPKRRKESPDRDEHSRSRESSREVPIHSERRGKFKQIYLNCLRTGCKERCSTRETLDRHMYEAHRINAHRCLFLDCRESFHDKDELYRHVRSKHFDVHNWDCYACPESFIRPEHLCQHFYFEHSEGRFECIEPDCDFVGSNRSLVINHYNDKHLDINRNGQRKIGFNRSTSHSYGSSSDERTSTTESLAKPWFRSTHYYSTEDNKQTSTDGAESDESSSSTCEALNSSKYKLTTINCTRNDCQQFFLKIEELNRHLKFVHNQLPVRCLVRKCRESFEERDQMDRHIRYDHPDVTRWQCPICEHVSKYRFDLYNHLRRSHEEGIFNCVSKNCEFVGKYRADVIAHFDIIHRHLCNDRTSKWSKNNLSRTYS